MMVRTDPGIETPADLNGKRIGIPEFQQTVATGLAPSCRMNSAYVEQHGFFMERIADIATAARTALGRPRGVNLQHAQLARTSARCSSDGALDATKLYRTHRNLVDRSPDPPRQAGPLVVRRSRGRSIASTKTNIFPINHCVVVRRSLYEKYPWIVLNLYSAFAAARAEGAARRHHGAGLPFRNRGCRRGRAARALRADPMAYGVKATRKVLETIADYVHAQGLTDRRVKIEELFAPVAMDL